jgi:hypothetical protein
MIRRRGASPLPSGHPQLLGQIPKHHQGNLIVAPQMADMLLAARTIDPRRIVTLGSSSTVVAPTFSATSSAAHRHRAVHARANRRACIFTKLGIADRDELARLLRARATN